MPTQSSQTSPSRYEKDFNAVFEILLDMSKQNGMMFKQYTSLAQQQLLLGQSLKQLLSAKISIFSPGSGVSKDKSSHKTTSSQTEWRIDEAIPQFDGNQSLDTQSEESLPLHGGVLPQVNLGHTSCTEDCCQTTLDGESGVDVSLVQSTGDTKPPRRARRQKKKGNTTRKNCQRFPKQFKPFTMWLLWLGGVKPNFNMNSGFSSPRMRSLLYPTVKNGPTKTATTHPR